MARIGVQRWSLNRRMRACVTLCHSLCTATRSPAIFLGNGVIPLMRLDIYDHMISIKLISGPFAGHMGTIIAALARNPSLILAWILLYLQMHGYQRVAHHEAWGCDQYTAVQLGLHNVNEVQLAVTADTSPCEVCLRGRSLTSLGLTACLLKTPYTALCGIPRRLEMTGALIPVLLRAITLQHCRIVVRGILGQYQYYCMFYLVTHIVGSNLKSKNQEVSGFSDQWVLNDIVDFNEIWHKCLSTLLFETPKFSRNLKKSKFKKFSHLKKSALTFAQGCMTVYQPKVCTPSTLSNVSGCCVSRICGLNQSSNKMSHS